MTFGERLLKFMSAANLTQKQLAEQIAVTPARLNYWVKDKREPDISYIVALAKALGVSGDDLLGIEAEDRISEDEMAMVRAYRRLDVPGKAAVMDSLKSQQRRIADYGCAAHKIGEPASGRSIPLIQGANESEIQMQYFAKMERRELEQEEEKVPVDASSAEN